MSRSSDDLLKQQIDVPCPDCGRKNTATLKQVQRQERVVCRGCGVIIKLRDSGGGVDKLRRSLDSLERGLRI
jgi:ribosomal protein S27E